METFIAKKADTKLIEKQSAREPCESSALCKSEGGITSACHQDSATHAEVGPDIQCVHDHGPTDAESLTTILSR